MAVIAPVECPHCEKKFKPKGDVAGKKIKCPFCKEPFSVPAAKQGQIKAGNPKVKPKGKAAPVVVASEDDDEPVPVLNAAPEVSAAPEAENLDGDENPYDVKTQDLRARCPNCANEMASANAVICLKCGYNTLTREIGKSETTLGLTFKQRLLYLLPAMGAAAFAFFSVIFLIYYAVVSPLHVAGTMMFWTDAESMRMWTTVIFLTWIWAAGMFCFKKFIEKPKPDEIKTS